ncbi:ATP-binding cassette domain-containing protein [Streptomyces lancefieldiae]|uniref:ATP-binding cassette domain-containing protein n=1 Tax=Streptomyces lancefieldiae TaxID=3075520 RepID=UPI00374E0F5C
MSWSPGPVPTTPPMAEHPADGPSTAGSGTTAPRRRVPPAGSPGGVSRRSRGAEADQRGVDAAGSVFALLGPNGAGKTTAVKVLSTLLTGDAGDLHVGGRPCR